MLSDERLDEIRNEYPRDDNCWEGRAFNELLAEIDRLRAASVPPAGAVKVRVAVTMEPDGKRWFAVGSNCFDDESILHKAEQARVGYYTTYGDLYVMPPKPAEVTGEVEGV